jgi:hypothetical protein
MARLREKRGPARPYGLVAAVVALGVALFILSSTAMAGQDELKGGSVVIQLKNSRGLKLKPKSITLPITGGAVDPADGSGTVQVVGGFKAKRGKSKTQVKITTLTLGANGGQGSITAKVNKDFVANFGTLSGGSVARTGWGATISNVGATIAGRGAKALNQALSPRKKRKGAKKSAARKIKGGQALGTIVSILTDPRSVEVVPGTGTLTLHTNLSGTFASKLPQHCIEPLSGGVAPIAPATQSLADFDFPVTGGAAAPDFSAGEVITGGGQAITKNSTLPGLLTPAACPSAAPPDGTQLISTDLSVAFDLNTMRAIATLPGGTTLPRAPLASIDFSTGTRSVDPATKTLEVTGATVRLADLAAPLLNQNFPNESGDASNDFAGGDEIGTIDLTGVKLR